MRNFVKQCHYCQIMLVTPREYEDFCSIACVVKYDEEMAYQCQMDEEEAAEYDLREY